MTALELWLTQATRGLAAESGAQVRAEITEHYEQAMASGATSDQAVVSLGSPRDANRQYRRVLLTLSESELLRNHTRESRFVCRKPWARAALQAVPFGGLGAAVELYRMGSPLFFVPVILSLTLVAAILPMYFTPSTPRHRHIVLTVKWASLAAAFAWIASVSWPAAASVNSVLYMAHVDYAHRAIRRKLPQSRWPRQLYF